MLTQCSHCEKNNIARKQVYQETIPYEYIISRSSDDFTLAKSGATMAVAMLDSNKLDIQLIFRVGRRLSFSMLTDDISLNCHPVWGPDDQSIIFDSNRNQKIAIWELSLSEKEPKLLIDSDDGMCFAANLSPDGSKIAYTSAKYSDPHWWTYYITCPLGENVRPENFQIILRDIQSKKDKIITFGMLPVFSPDGTKIAYSSYNGNDWDLWTIMLSSGEKKQLTSTSDNDFYASWSPDGKWIAFCRENPLKSTSDIWLIHPDGKSLMQLTSTKNNNEGGPFWNNDGIYIHTDNGENTPYDIALIPSELLPIAEIETSEPVSKKKDFTIQILNSTMINGLAARTQKLLESKGYTVADIGNTKKERNLYKGKIYYKPGARNMAKEIAEIIPGTQRLYESTKFKYDIVVVLGRNTKL